MKRSLLSLLVFVCLSSQSQNVGINTTSPQASLDVYGDVIFRSADLVVADGTTLAMDVASNRFSYYRVSGPTADFTISGISAAVEGRLVTLFNRSGFEMTLVNLDAGATSEDRIITGTNSDLVIGNKGIVNLQYDGLEQKWVVLSNNKFNGGTVSGGWGLSGNSGTNSATNFIGTNDAQPFVIRGNNSIVASFSGGFPNVNLIGQNYQRTGIGIIGAGDPTHTLEVGLADIAGGSVGVLGIRGTNHMTHFNYGTNEDVYIRGGKTGSSIILNDAPGLGNVGIGTPYIPTFAKLEIRINDEQRGWAVGTATYNLHSFLGGAGRTTNSEGAYIGTSGTVTGGAPAPLHFFTNAQWAQMTILPNGNVGIGTTNPSYKLSVKGNIRSEELVVETGWADYVFERSYNLKPLHEVEAFILKNKHLEGIPSAKEIQANGLSVGAVQTRMMEKIEELTLYIIELKKEIDSLKKQ